MKDNKRKKGQCLLEPENITTQGKRHYREYSLNGLEEHVVADEFIVPLIEGLPDNVVQILYYSATEMINNAIDHSEGNEVSVALKSDPDRVTIWIVDDGIGIFNKIKRVFKLEIRVMLYWSCVRGNSLLIQNITQAKAFSSHRALVTPSIYFQIRWCFGE